MMDGDRGYSLVSQQIRELILEGAITVPETDLSLSDRDVYDGDTLVRKKGWFNDENLERRVQPSSFDVTLSEELFILDTDEMLRPQNTQSVRRTVLQTSKLSRPHIDISGGFEVRSGHNYLVRLREKISPIILSGADFFRSQPKSSTGRIFPVTRLMADHNASYDEIKNIDDPLSLWLLIQPLPFSFVIRPGDTLSQSRFFKGDARLSSAEVLEESKRHNLLYRKSTEEGEEPEPIEITRKMITEGGLEIGLDLIAAQTKGIPGLRVRRNPTPIDLSRRDYVPEEFFSPVIVNGGNGKLKGEGEHYLFASSEMISIPPHLSAELRRHSREGIEGRSHDAGFIDNGFVGDVVFEITPDERTSVPINHGMPISRLDFYRTSEMPDKVYGAQIGSNYHEQFGPKTSKHFMPFDFGRAAKDFQKLSRIVLVHDAEVLRGFRSLQEGFEPISERNAKNLLETLEDGFFHSRYDCEDDELVLQPIPYAIVFDNQERVFSYVRTKDPKDFGDKRLLGKHSIGLGGHVTIEDGPEYVKNCLEREVMEEEVRFLGNISEPLLVGTLVSRDKPVDRVHFGLVYAIHTDGGVTPNESSIGYAGFVPLEDVRPGFMEAETETWSRILMPHLRSIYEVSK